MTIDKSKLSTLAIIVAMDNNGGIGRENKLLWHIPEDLQYFKRITMGKPLIMGRKTFDSIGRPLPGRLSIVITRQSNWQFEGVSVAHSFEQALSIAHDYVGKYADKYGQVTNDCANEIMIVGGEQVYALSLPVVQRIYLTEVDACLSADAFFPMIDPDQWRLLEESPPVVSTTTGYSLRYKVLVRT